MTDATCIHNENPDLTTACLHNRPYKTDRRASTTNNV